MSENRGIKVVLLGEAGVGKTNLIRVAMGKSFETNINSTLASSFYEAQINVNDKIYQYYLWDTAGQEVYRCVNKIFIKESKVVIIVFAINNRESFNNVDFWINYVKEILDDDTYILALVGNKGDLYDDQEIPDEEMDKKAKSFGIKFKITSAATDAQGFKTFLDELLEEYIVKYKPEEISVPDSFMIKNKKHKKKKDNESKCC